MTLRHKILVDMSATIIHHGHIRLLKFAADLGSVCVALTTDEEILAKKGFIPELDFDSRREILESIRYVDSVVPSPWLITNSFLNDLGVDFLVHGHDNVNEISSEKLILIPRTELISSNEIRNRSFEIVSKTLNS